MRLSLFRERITNYSLYSHPNFFSTVMMLCLRLFIGIQPLEFKNGLANFWSSFSNFFHFTNRTLKTIARDTFNSSSTSVFDLSLFNMNFSFETLSQTWIFETDRISSSKANPIFRYAALWPNSNSYRNDILNSFLSKKKNS